MYIEPIYLFNPLLFSMFRSFLSFFLTLHNIEKTMYGIKCEKQILKTWLMYRFKNDFYNLISTLGYDLLFD